jgi:hypothetical protein
LILAPTKGGLEARRRAQRRCRPRLVRIGPSFPHGAFGLLDCQRNRLTTGHVAGLNAAKIIFNLPAQKSVQAHASLAAVCRDSPPAPKARVSWVNADLRSRVGSVALPFKKHVWRRNGCQFLKRDGFFPAKQLRSTPSGERLGWGHARCWLQFCTGPTPALPHEGGEQYRHCAALAFTSFGCGAYTRL